MAPVGTPGGVVVAVDSSTEAREALMWAADEAGRRHATLHIVHAIPRPRGLPKDDPTVDEDTVELGDWICRRAVKRVVHAHPGMTPTSQVLLGRAPKELLEVSADAALLVLGALGHGAIAGKLLGSVSQQVTTHARIPVVVVRGERPPADAPVVVGVDSSEQAMAALGFALVDAERRGVGLRVVRGSYLEFASGGMAPGTWPVYYDSMLDVERDAVAALVEQASRRHPGVDVELRDVRAHPVEALLHECADAALLVVGTRGRGGFAGLRLGSVSQGVLTRARCTVAVVHAGGPRGH